MVAFNEDDKKKAQDCIENMSNFSEISSIHNYDFNGVNQYRILFKLSISNMEIVPKIHSIFQKNQISDPSIRISGGNS
jgi:hypothetical protein